MDQEVSSLHSSLDPNYWKNKRVLVTGHTGFKGGYLCLWLKKLGAVVSGISLAAPEESFFEQTQLSSILRHNIYFDLRHNPQDLLVHLQEIRPQVVFHLAAMPLVRESYRLPVETFDTNVMGTVHLLDGLKNLEGVEQILNVTTDKCYENKEWVWGYRENDPLGGKDPYSASKACSEIVTHAYYQSFFAAKNIGLASARGGNVYGGGDYSLDRLIPDCIRAHENKTSIELRYPEATRPWQYVLDVLHGYLILVQKMMDVPEFFSGAWNFAPDDSAHMSVDEVVKKVFYHLGYPIPPIQYPLSEKKGGVGTKALLHEAHSLVLSNHKAKKYLQHTQLFDMNEGIKESVKWYRLAKKLSSKELLEYTLSVIPETFRKGTAHGIDKGRYHGQGEAVL